MQLSAFLTLLYSSTALGSALRLVPREPECPKPDGEKDDQVIAHYKTTGNCFSYQGEGNRDKSLAPCSGEDGYCQAEMGTDGSVEGCMLFMPEGTDEDDYPGGTDEDCNEYKIGECMCECPLCEEIAKIVIEGLSRLDDVICAVMLSALQTVADIGIMFVPGGQATTAVMKAAQGAKSFYQNGQRASIFFGNWIGPTCGIPEFDFSLTDVFTNLVEAPESLTEGDPTGCLRDSGCQDLPPPIQG